MTEALADIITVVPEMLVVGFLVFLRVGAAMGLLPAFGEMMVPVRVRLGLALALTAVVVPIVTPDVRTPLAEAQPLLLLMPTEVIVGLTLGLSLRFMVMALQIAGSIAAQSTSLSQLFGGAGIDPQPAIGFVFVLGGLALATLLGFHIKIVSMFILSYDIVGLGSPIFASDLAGLGVAQVSTALELAFVLAAPFVIGSLVYNLTLGVINRAMPQLMVAFVGAPAITFGALVLLALATPLILTIWIEALDHRLSNPFGPN